MEKEEKLEKDNNLLYYMPDYLFYTNKKNTRKIKNKKRTNKKKKINNRKKTNKKLLGGYWFYPSKKIREFKDKIIEYLKLLQEYNNCKILESCSNLELINNKIKKMYQDNQYLTYKYRKN